MHLLKVCGNRFLRFNRDLVLPSIFEYSDQSVTSFQPQNRQFSTTSVESFIRSRNPSTVSYRKYSTARLLTSPREDIKAPCESLAEFIWKDVDKWSKHTAICSAETGKKYSYEELRVLCRRFAVALKQKQFKKGEILTIILPNMPEYLVILLGTIEAGLVPTTLNPTFTAAEISRQLQDSKTSVIVTLSSLTELVNSAKELIETRTKEEFKFSLITLDHSPASNSKFEQMIDKRFDEYELDVKISGDDVAMLLYSSGTTGFPKGVQLTHSGLMHNLLQISTGDMKHVKETSGEFQEVVPAVLPFFHIFGISVVILTSLMYGCKIISLTHFKPETYSRIIKEEQATLLHLVPTLTYFLTSHPLIKPNHLESVRLSFFAGAATPKLEIDKIIKLSGHKMATINGYGLTEMSGAVCAIINGPCNGSSGPPVASTVIKIVGIDGSLQPQYHEGEICVKGPQIMKGYFNNPEATKDAIDADGFLHTGDIGYYSYDNNIFFVDRMKEILKVKGFQVAPAELESVIKGYEGVEDVGIIGIPDPRSGEIPVAFVVPKSSQQIRENDLKHFVAEKVAPYKQLSRVILTESIPRNSSGKVLRRKLREMYENLS